MKIIPFLKKNLTLFNVFIFGVLIFTGSYLFTCASATDTANLHIYITNSTSPIENARVYINNNPAFISNSVGYVGANIPTGETTIRVEYSGYAPYETVMNITEDSDVHIKLSKLGLSFFGIKELLLVGFIIIFLSLIFKFGKKYKK